MANKEMKRKFILECNKLYRTLHYRSKTIFLDDQEAPPTSQSTITSQNKDDVEIENAKRSNVSQPDTEYHKIAATWATELAKMERLQQLFAEKAMNNIVLFEGQMRTLTRNSVQFNATSFCSTRSSTPFRATIDQYRQRCSSLVCII
ncbi:hypothetical protein RN001_009391 [Aquatica leii]|uniref:Uncharacterized protein n=1 Tax=Aquatica leii TaxID=1421715 RepID=A0AAN7SPX2_9COLE|nr:hypothetical protein RN001_009391 [Aquatica leii]